MELPNKSSKCPSCNETLDGSTCVEGKDVMPAEGDYSVCLYCGAVLQFEEGLFLRELSSQELESIKIVNEKIYYSLLKAKTIAKKYRAEKN